MSSGVLDHFLEGDVYDDSLDALYLILTDKSLYDIIIDVGLPLQHHGLRFNCRALCLNGKILAFRPKMFLANDGNFREMRHFAPWNRPKYCEQYQLPTKFQELQGERFVPIGDVILETRDANFAAETCEELFTPDSPHIDM